MPHVNPTRFRVDADTGTVKIGQHPLADRGQERLYIRHLRSNPQAAFVVDYLVTTPKWTPSGVLIKGHVTFHEEGGEQLGVGFGPKWIEIAPTWVTSWGIATDAFDTSAPRQNLT